MSDTAPKVDDDPSGNFWSFRRSIEKLIAEVRQWMELDDDAASVGVSVTSTGHVTLSMHLVTQADFDRVTEGEGEPVTITGDTGAFDSLTYRRADLTVVVYGPRRSTGVTSV